MSQALSNIKSELRDVANTADQRAGGDLRLGLITFVDTITVEHSLTTDTEAVLMTLDGLTLSPFGQPPEASDEALREMLNDSACVASGDFNIPFRANGIKHAILITDNLPAGCDDQFTTGPPPIENDLENAYSRADEAAKLGIRIGAMYVRTNGSPGRCALGGQQVCEIMRNYADVTGGVFDELASNAKGIAAAIDPQVNACPDCNGNGINDLCDIDCAGAPGCVPACGGSIDCQPNAIPDECGLE